jgi:hypothetical protein
MLGLSVAVVTLLIYVVRMLMLYILLTYLSSSILKYKLYLL